VTLARLEPDIPPSVHALVLSKPVSFFSFRHGAGVNDLGIGPRIDGGRFIRLGVAQSAGPRREIGYHALKPSGAHAKHVGKRIRQTPAQRQAQRPAFSSARTMRSMLMQRASSGMSKPATDTAWSHVFSETV
jgi:hypothetical protein